MDSWRRSACYPRRTFYPFSNGPSIWNHWITKTCFRTCSTCMSRSQAPFCLCTRRVITDHAEGTFGRLRYLLGGDRPSQTAHQAMSPRLLKGYGLEFQQHKGGISTVAQRKLAPPLHRLPPILHTPCQNPMPGYSKGPRGLSVQSRVNGIFTAASVSPSSWSRQRSSRYTIRAGRNLPDKEFRSVAPICFQKGRTLS